MASSFFGGQISEVTPEFMDVDIITGLPNKVWSGFIEQHITADVAFGVWQYYTITGDQDYMDRYGYELIFDTARFWVSRLEDKDRLISEDVDPEGRTVFSETDTVDGKYHICVVRRYLAGSGIRLRRSRDARRKTEDRSDTS